MRSRRGWDPTMRSARRILQLVAGAVWEIVRTDEHLEALKCACWRAPGVTR